MRDSTTKKVVILNNFVSPYVAEAIIILKDYDPRLEGKAIEDAEKIVASYIEKRDKKGRLKKSTVRRKSSFIRYAVCAAVFFVSAALFLVLK